MEAQELSIPPVRLDAASPQTGYMPQLDGMRTLAVALVLILHWMPARYTRGVTWGGHGVDLFFVLSGFLITGILLRTRPEVDSGTTPVGYTLRHFLMRRVLRLCPLYCAVLLAITVAKDLSPGLQASLWTYTFQRAHPVERWGRRVGLALLEPGGRGAVA